MYEPIEEYHFLLSERPGFLQNFCAVWLEAWLSLIQPLWKTRLRIRYAKGWQNTSRKVNGIETAQPTGLNPVGCVILLLGIP